MSVQLDRYSRSTVNFLNILYSEEYSTQNSKIYKNDMSPLAQFSCRGLCKTLNRNIYDSLGCELKWKKLNDDGDTEEVAWKEKGIYILLLKSRSIMTNKLHCGDRRKWGFFSWFYRVITTEVYIGLCSRELHTTVIAFLVPSNVRRALINLNKDAESVLYFWNEMNSLVEIPLDVKNVHCMKH